MFDWKSQRLESVLWSICRRREWPVWTVSWLLDASCKNNATSPEQCVKMVQFSLSEHLVLQETIIISLFMFEHNYFLLSITFSHLCFHLLLAVGWINLFGKLKFICLENILGELFLTARFFILFLLSFLQTRNGFTEDNGTFHFGERTIQSWEWC